ncbi:glycosyltransferase family 4 protein [Patescibacteria group bacterium]
MKIAQVCPYNIFRGGGVYSHIQYLSDELRRREHEVKIITPSVKGEDTDKEDIIFIGKCEDVFFNNTQGDISFARGDEKDKLKKVLQEEKFDILHFHEPASPVLPLQILQESNSINVATFHASFPGNIVGKSIETLAATIFSSITNVLDGVIAVSEVPKKYFKEYYKGKIHVVPNGIDLDVYKPSNEPFEKYMDGKVNILFLGRLDKRKGVMYLLKAFRKLNKKIENLRLIIAGKGEQLNKVKDYVRKHKLKNVEILGFIKEKDKPGIYASCDIFCAPALYGESLGIVLLEAMASGKPVVAFANPGYKTVLKGTGSLFLVKPKDVKGLTKKLEILCNDKKLRKFVGEWGISEVKSYSWIRVCDDVLKVYEEAILKRENANKEKSKKGLRIKVQSWLKQLNEKIFK